MITKTVDIIVTSVHQTTAGKMIFGRLDERADHSPRASASAEGSAGPVASAAAAAAASSAVRPGFVTESSRAESFPRAADASGDRPARPLVPEPRQD
jgi:hypothetical protein